MPEDHLSPFGDANTHPLTPSPWDSFSSAPSIDDTPTMPAPPGVHGSGGRQNAGLSPVPAPPVPMGKTRGITRRKALVAAGAGVIGLGALGVGLGHVLTQRDSIPNVFASDAGQINHLLRRAGFGPAPGDVGDYLDAGVQGAMDRLVNYDGISDDLDSRLSQTSFDFTKPQDLMRWFLLRMIYSKRPLEEKMTLFWSGVLTSGLEKVGQPQYRPTLIQQNKLLRANAMGKLDDLIRAVTIDPAMLIWLDGRRNTGNNPNENYSRELMELFTLGIDDAQGNPNYTQNDVHQGALALTGWHPEPSNGGYQGVLSPGRQYHGTVTYLGHTGQLGLDDVVRIVCAHPATPRHLAWRMWNFFVYATELSDPALQPIVDAYNQQDHSIRAMVQAMLTSPEFFGAKAYRGKVKSPVEFLVGAIRGLGVEVTGTGLPQVMLPMGQVLFDPPNVAGWPGDQDSSNWMSTQAWMARVNFNNLLAAAATGTAVVGKQYTTNSNATVTCPVQQVINSRGISRAPDLQDYLVAILLDNTLSDDRRAALSDTLAQASKAGPTLALSGGGSVSAANVRQMLYLLLSMPEYQLN
jgi:uncharacterized protein (DUF1800 family)